MKSKKYYAVAGVNAYGVYDSYERVLTCKCYIAEFKLKKFDTFDEAKVWAENTYDDLQLNCSVEYKIGEIKKLNWCYFRRKI